MSNSTHLYHLSVLCYGQAVPLLWRMLKHGSATVAFAEYQGMLRKARRLLRQHKDNGALVSSFRPNVLVRGDSWITLT